MIEDKINFPQYVPDGVKKAINSMVYGDEIKPRGWIHTLESQEKDSIQYKEIKKEIDTLKRLGTDCRMKDVFILLSDFTNTQWRDYIYSAWSTDRNYKKVRDTHYKIKEINQKIEKTAIKLSNLIESLSEIPYSHFPSEFYSIQTLLNKTDNTSDDNRNLDMWRGLRKTLLNDLYTWKTAPKLSAILKTVAKASREFEPTEDEEDTQEAVKTRQHNPKTEYIRALTSHLINTHSFVISTQIEKAIAITTNVAINKPDIDASYDDVKKAIKNIPNKIPVYDPKYDKSYEEIIAELLPALSCDKNNE
jgi:predicted DNA-binding transcriptional regulator